MTLSNIFRGVTGELEINRVVGGIGALSYIICANVFVGWEVFWNGHPFDLTAYCVAFPAGLGVAVGSIAGAVAIKDKSVAAARQTEQTTQGAG